MNLMRALYLAIFLLPVASWSGITVGTGGNRSSALKIFAHKVESKLGHQSSEFDRTLIAEDIEQLGPIGASEVILRLHNDTLQIALSGDPAQSAGIWLMNWKKWDALSAAERTHLFLMAFYFTTHLPSSTQPQLELEVLRDFSNRTIDQELIDLMSKLDLPKHAAEVQCQGVKPSEVKAAEMDFKLRMEKFSKAAFQRIAWGPYPVMPVLARRRLKNEIYRSEVQMVVKPLFLGKESSELEEKIAVNFRRNAIPSSKNRVVFNYCYYRLMDESLKNLYSAHETLPWVTCDDLGIDDCSHNSLDDRNFGLSLPMTKGPAL